MDMGPYNGPLSGFLAEHRILQVYTFPGPWSWMNRGAVRMVNALVDALREKYGFTEKTRWGVMGGSMGGMGALIYAASHGDDPAYTPTACLAHCPCVDVIDRIYCKENVPRTFFCAVADYEMPIAEALKTISPVCRVDDLPRIPYHIINDLSDELFPPEQMDAYVETLIGKDHTVTYHRLPDCRHGELTGEEWEVIREFLLGHLVK
jgi:pimeloyl-ACP methyl ester carboxylesterase